MRVMVYALVLVALSVATVLATGFGTRSAIFLYDEVRPFVTRYTAPFCISRLQERDVTFTQLSDQVTGQCRVLNAVKVSVINGTRLSRPATMTCGLALSLSEWVTEINHLSQKHFGDRIKHIQHVGTFNCRQKRNSNGLSEHAYANAIDIKGFTIGEKRYTVTRDWSSPRGGTFLREAFNDACWTFGLALGPQNDRAHSGHFHLDNGTYLGLSKFRCLQR
jgi:hypothetical protein